MGPLGSTRCEHVTLTNKVMKKIFSRLSVITLTALALASSDSRSAARADEAAATDQPAPQRFAVQLGSFSNDADARDWVRKLKAAGLPAYAERRVNPDGFPRTLVRMGPYINRGEASDDVAKLREMGIPDDHPQANTRDSAPATAVRTTAREIEQQAKHASVRQWWRARESIGHGQCDAIEGTPAEDRHANGDVVDTPLVSALFQQGNYTLVYRYPSGTYLLYASSERSCDDTMRRLIQQADE